MDIHPSHNLATPPNGDPEEPKWTAIQRGKESEWGLDWITPWLVEHAAPHTASWQNRVTFLKEVSKWYYTLYVIHVGQPDLPPEISQFTKDS